MFHTGSSRRVRFPCVLTSRSMSDEIENPAIHLLRLAQQLAEKEGREVDEESFLKLAFELDKPADEDDPNSQPR